MANVYDFKVKDRSGNEVSLNDYAGKVLLIVNTATGCGFTPHYEPLEAMYKDLKDKGTGLLVGFILLFAIGLILQFLLSAAGGRTFGCAGLAQW